MILQPITLQIPRDALYSPSPYAPLVLSKDNVRAVEVEEALLEVILGVILVERDEVLNE